MRRFLAVFGIATTLCSASVREILTVYQPLSFHGTDTAETFGKEVIQAGVKPTPMVLSGAMPEVLVAAVAHPHRLAFIGNYPFEENNLLALCKIELNAEIEDRELLVSFDVSKVAIPEEVDLSIRTILQLSIKAVQRTLKMYYLEDDQPKTYRIEITGTNEKNATLKNLSEKVVLKK